MKDRVGEEHITNEGYKVRIVEYYSSVNVIVRFEAGNIKKVEYGDLKKGKVKNPYHKSIFGVGYLREGIHKVSENGVKTDCYNTWANMMMRCYCEK